MMYLRLLFISLLFSLSTIASGQVVLRDKSILNYQRGDRLFMHFGFTLGLNYMDYRTVLSELSEMKMESGRLKLGFTVGIISELRLRPDLGLRFMPGLEFATRRMLYTHVPDAEKNKTDALNEHVYLTFPLMLKYKAKRMNNYRPFVTLGPSVKYDFHKHRRINPDQSVYFRTKPMDFFIEGGLGSDFYLPYFKLGIELRMAIGLTDVLIHKHDKNNPGYEGYTDVIKKMRARLFSICFHFE